MKYLVWSRSRLVLAGLVILILSQIAVADSVGSYVLVGETTLKATSSNGSIIITGVDSASEITIYSSNCDATDLPVVNSAPPLLTIAGIENCNLSLTVPESLLVELYSDNGSVRTSGGFPSILVRAINGGIIVSGSNASLVDAKSTNGNVRLTDVGILGSKLTAIADNGFIKLTRVSGPFSIRAFNGDITGDNLTFPGVSTSTFNNRNGDIKIKRVKIQTRGDGKSYKLAAVGSTQNGRVIISRGPSFRGNKRYSDGQTVFTGIEPKASVTLRTINGDISFLR